ncbi:MAG: hypothetical protein ACK559_34500, partial [bacterium]
LDRAQRGIGRHAGEDVPGRDDEPLQLHPVGDPVPDAAGSRALGLVLAFLEELGEPFLARWVDRQRLGGGGAVEHDHVARGVGQHLAGGLSHARVGEAAVAHREADEPLDPAQVR